MISSPEPSAVASSITLAPKYLLSGWGSGRSLYSSIAGRYLLGMFQPSPVASRAVVSAMRYPPSFPSIPSIPCCILFKHPLGVNSYRSPICRPRRVLFLSCLKPTTGGLYARGHNRRRSHRRRRHSPDGRSGRWALDNLTAIDDRPRASILLPEGYLHLFAKLLYRGVSPLHPTPDREEILEVEHILLDFGIILGAGLVAQFLATFLRIPEMIVLVAVGALIGPSALGIVENPLNGVGAQLIFTVGVAMILFHGGVGISLRVISRTAVGLGLLILPGVAISAFVVAAIVAVSLLVALMIGAVLASTDPAIIIPLFERLGLRPKVSQTVIAESAFNDVTGTVLTLTLVSAVEAAHFSVSGPVFEFLRGTRAGSRYRGWSRVAPRLRCRLDGACRDLGRVAGRGDPSGGGARVLLERDLGWVRLPRRLRDGSDRGQHGGVQASPARGERKDARRLRRAGG